ncbi:MAG: hypothetical protein WKF58_01080 [Ilumatobacteraceae bacterium]
MLNHRPTTLSARAAMPHHRPARRIRRDASSTTPPRTRVARTMASVPQTTATMKNTGIHAVAMPTMPSTSDAVVPFGRSGGLRST